MHGSDATDRPPEAVATAEVPGAAGLTSMGRTLARRILIYLPGSVVPAVLTLVTSMIFTRVFTPAEFGMFSLAAIVIATPIKTMSTTWLVQSVTKFLPPEREEEGRRRILDAVFLAVGAIATAQCLLGVAAIVLGRLVLADDWQSFLVPIVLFVLAISLFEVMSAVLAAEGRASVYTTFKLVDSVVTLGLRLLFVSSVFSMNITLMLVSVALSNGALVPLMWRRIGLPAPTRLPAVARRQQNRLAAWAFVTFGFPMTLWLFSSILLDVGDRWVLKILLGSGAVGIYDANYRLIGGVAALLVVPITITVHPFVMGLSGQVDESQVGRVIGVVIDNLAVVALFAVGVTFLLHKDLAYVLLGPGFRQGSVIMPVVLAGVFCANIGTFAHKPFEIVGRTRTMVVSGFAAAAANMVFCFALIPIMGYPGAAYATLLAYLLYAVLVSVLGRRIISWHLDWKRILGQAAIVVLGVAVIAVGRTLADVGYVAELASTLVGCALLMALMVLDVTRNAGARSVSGVGL